MRKFKFLMFSLLLAGAAFTSCSKDDLLDVPELDNPVVTIKRDGVAITTINDKNAGEVVPVVARFDMGAQKDRLEKIKITTEIQGKPYVVLDSTLNDGWFNRGDKYLERKYNIAVGQTISRITFETKDVKGHVGSTTITVTPNGSVKPNVNRVVLLAGQLNTSAPYGGFYSVALAKDYKLKDAVTNAPYIDFVYYYGGTHAATLAPISEAILYDQVNGPAGIRDVMPEFVQRNPTQFAKVTADNFTNKTFPNNATFAVAGMRGLAVNDCIAFKTAFGLNGLIKVNKIMGTTQETRAIEIDVMVIQ